MSNSINDKLERVRKPRVHIKYEVETEGGAVQKELPFVVGVLGDYTGNAPGQPVKPLKERKFVQIDRDNFDDVMTRHSPGINMRVENTLKEDGSEFGVELQFNRMEDFEPTQVVQQIPELKKLMDLRNKLRDLLTKSDRSDKLENILEETLQDQELLTKFAKGLGIEKSEEDDAKKLETENSE